MCQVGTLNLTRSALYRRCVFGVTEVNLCDISYRGEDDVTHVGE